MVSTGIKNARSAAPPKRALPSRTAEAIRTGHQDSIRAYTRYTYDYDYLATQKDGKPMLSGLLQSNLIYWISRKTVGDEKRPEWARLSITHLAQICGGVERKSVATALADLLKRGIIAAPVREGCAKNAPKMYKLCPQNWRKAAPYSPEIDSDLLALAKSVEAGWEKHAEADGPPEAETHVVKPGKRSHPQPVAMPVKGAEPFVLRVVYHSEFDEPVAFRAHAGHNGRLQVTACRPTANVVWGDEEKANACSRTQPHGGNPSEENTALAQYRDYLNPLILELWGTAKDDGFIRTVFAAANGAPVEILQAQVELRFRSAQGATMFHAEARKHQPGLLVSLATDAARAFILRQSIEKTRNDHMPPVEARKPPEPLNPARRWDRIRRELQKRLTPVSYGNWFAYTWQVEETPDTVTVVVDGDEEAAQFLAEEYGAIIAEICGALNEPASIQWRAGR